MVITFNINNSNNKASQYHQQPPQNQQQQELQELPPPKYDQAFTPISNKDPEQAGSSQRPYPPPITEEHFGQVNGFTKFIKMGVLFLFLPKKPILV